MPNDTYNKKVTAHIKTYQVDPASGTLELLSNDSLIYQRADSYQPFQLIINYPDSSSVPDSVSIWFESQGYGSGTTSCGNSHFLYLDDLEFHFSPMVSTSINNSSFKDKLKIFPNPAKNTFLLQDNNLKIQSLTLTDLSGRKVKTFSAESKTLNLSGVAAGLYLLQVKTKEGTITQKVQVQ
ncbi:MAG TPA: T9SS type A sorting domain-containing protein [Edaphocola sp.]|nr:T9SS type A sorting domain-containing protein [Edaphocola sp.]